MAGKSNGDRTYEVMLKDGTVVSVAALNAVKATALEEAAQAWEAKAAEALERGEEEGGSVYAAASILARARIKMIKAVNL
jgi:hypothetical protein